MDRALCLIGVLLVGCATRPEQPPAAPPPTPVSRPVSAPAPTFPDQRAAFAAAYDHLRHGRFTEAEGIFTNLLQRYSVLEDYVLHYLARSRVGTGDAEGALELWNRLAAHHPSSVLIPEASLERGRLLRARGKLVEARAAIALTRAAESDAIRFAGGLELAEIDVAEGQIARAHRSLMEIREAAPGTEAGRKAKQRVTELRQLDPTLAPIGAAREAELRLLVREGDHAAAITLADQLLAVAVEAKRPSLLRSRASAELGSGATDAGLSTLRQISTRYPRSSVAPEALFRAARVLWNGDRNVEAQEAFSDFLRRYPRDRNASESLYAIARIEQDSGRAEQAVRTYNRLAVSYPSSRLAREGRWRIGWIHLQARNWVAAAESFGRLVRGSGAEAADAIYWQARALERAGNRESARRLYRRLVSEAATTYYGYWAERRLGMEASQARRVVAAPPPDRIGDPPPGIDRYHLTRALELQAARLPALARRELRRLEKSRPLNDSMARFLAQSYRAADGYRDFMRLAQRWSRDPYVRYPLAFWPDVTRRTAATGVDPVLVVALMRQESMFDPEARSHADARGLMQLLPATARSTALQIGHPAPTADDLYDPEVNIDLGVAHLAELFRLYQGDPFRSLAAYNGGREAVAKWDRRFGRLEQDEWVESITYRETRDYVKRVFSHYRMYQELYGAPPASGSGS